MLMLTMDEPSGAAYRVASCGCRSCDHTRMAPPHRVSLRHFRKRKRGGLSFIGSCADRIIKFASHSHCQPSGATKFSNNGRLLAAAPTEDARVPWLYLWFGTLVYTALGLG
jgi:hypothetical protein